MQQAVDDEIGGVVIPKSQKPDGSNPVGPLSVMIGTPAYGGMVHAGFAKSMFDLQRELQMCSIDAEFALVENISILPLARNIIAERFISSKNDYLLFIDSDLIFRPEDVVRMIKEFRGDVMGGLYPKKFINWRSVVNYIHSNVSIDQDKIQNISGLYSGMFAIPEGDDTLISLQLPFLVRFIPTGLMMIARSAFEKLIRSSPRAKTRLASDEGEKEIGVFFDNSISDTGYYLGEDFTFCQNLSENGGVIFACPWFVTSHVGPFPYRGDMSAIADAGLELD